MQVKYFVDVRFESFGEGGEGVGEGGCREWRERVGSSEIVRKFRSVVDRCYGCACGSVATRKCDANGEERTRNLKSVETETKIRPVYTLTYIPSVFP